MVWGFGVPEDVDDPVAIAVLEELEAVDAADEGCGVGGGVAGLVGAPYLDDVAVLLCHIVDGALVEAHGGHAGAGAGDVAVDGENDGVGVAGGGNGGDEAGVGNEERAHAVPIAGLALRTGDDAVDGVEDRLGRADVCGLGDGPAGMAGDGAGEMWRRGRRGSWRGGGCLGKCGGAGEHEDEGCGETLGLGELDHGVLGIGILYLAEDDLRKIWAS